MAAGGESDVIVISSDSEDSDSTEISTDCDNILTFTPTKRYSTACHRDHSLITNLSFFIDHRVKWIRTRMIVMESWATHTNHGKPKYVPLPHKRTKIKRNKYSYSCARIMLRKLFS